MNLKRRIWLFLGLLVVLVLSLDLAVSYHKFRQELQSEIEYDARTVYGYMMATRRVYQQAFIDSGLPVNSDTLGLLPAHAMSRISKDFANWNNSGIRFNNVSDVPRNPGNQADRFELAAMDWFRAHPDASERMESIVDDTGTGYLLYTAPIKIEPVCLKCHGRREDAPQSIQDKYTEAFGYRLGDLRGVVSVKLPTAKFETRFREVWLGQLAKSLVGYALLFLALGLLLERLVIRRLARLQAGAERIAQGDYDARVPAGGRDEICALAHSFNRMAEEVQNRDRSLSKLSLAVEQSPESVIITNLDARIEYVNSAFVDNTGYSREEVIGKNPRLLQSGRTPQETYQELWSVLKQGRVWRGKFLNQRKDGRDCIEEATIAPLRGPDGSVTHYISVKQDITEKSKAQEEINRLAYYDVLTGLPNRALLVNRLEHSLVVSRRQKHLDALVLINLDRFKNINTARGYETGDKLLVALGGRLTRHLREGDTLARMSADEFAVLLPSQAGEREVAGRQVLGVIERLHEDMRRPFVFGDDEATLSVSAGIAFYPQGHDDCPQEVLRRADTALHRAKAAGGGRTAFFDAGMGELAERRFLIERDLREAVKNGQLRLYLQSQVDAKGALVGAEALVRWQHPVQGMLLPGQFVPVAEESDLIVDLGAWVLGKACGIMAREKAADCPLQLSVNISPRHFDRPGFVPWLKHLVDEIGVDPSCLTLEVTESLIIDNVDEVVEKMTALANHGFHFSIDDFGTGYSSLAYLKRMPLNELKIDKAFVQDAPNNPSDAALVETILSVATHLGLKVVAEGVETEEQARFLNERAEVIHQGYLYGRPEPSEVWISRWRESVRSDES
jgi:diguanylate cyclase (GGDEF)-like protein/PAS domain S-box-containing protein